MRQEGHKSPEKALPSAVEPLDDCTARGLPGGDPGNGTGDGELLHRNVTLRSFLDRSHLILLAVLLGLAAAGLLTWSAERTYTSSTQLFVGAVGATKTA